ncbi:MAG: hypothetical protein ACREV0_04090 [Burkholderiales bacterium]
MDSYIIHIYRRTRGRPEAVVGTVEIAGVEGQRSFSNLKEMCEILLAPSAGYRRQPISPSAAKRGVTTVLNPRRK